LSLTLAFAAGWVSQPTFIPAPVPVDSSVTHTMYAAPHPASSGSTLADSIDAPAVAVYFSPNGGTRAAIIDCIDQAHTSILVAMYYLTDPTLADALVRAHQRGVTVEIVLDRTQQTARGGQAQRLIDVGVPVHFDARHQLQHNKFAVIDGATVVTGSQNWTASGESRNAENTVVMRDSRLADRFAATFVALAAGQPIANQNHQGGM